MFLVALENVLNTLVLFSVIDLLGELLGGLMSCWVRFVFAMASVVSILFALASLPLSKVRISSKPSVKSAVESMVVDIQSLIEKMVRNRPCFESPPNQLFFLCYFTIFD